MYVLFLYSAKKLKTNKMKWKSTEYKILILSDNAFQVCKITSYFGISWIMEYIGGEHQDTVRKPRLVMADRYLGFSFSV